jgi:hypothetical protein
VIELPSGQLPPDWNAGIKPYEHNYSPSIENIWKKHMKDVSVPYLEKVFDPEVPGYSTKFSGALRQPSGVKLYFDMQNHEGKIGEISRSLNFSEDGRHSFHNDYFEMNDDSHHGKGIGRRIYQKSEKDLYRHLTDSPHSRIHLRANISIGSYAWALHGYNWNTSQSMQAKVKLMKNLASLHDFDIHSGDALPKINSTLQNHYGINDIMDLNNSWQFAMLDNGQKYHINSLASSPNPYGHFGKKFMVDGIDSWDGSKPVHDNGQINHRVADLYNSHRDSQNSQTLDLSELLRKAI